MKLLEMKNRLALDTARLIFKNGIDAIFIGGTALNAFYLGYRYSEGIDLGYIDKNPKYEIEDLLKKNGYEVSSTDLKYRDIITYEGVSLKMDIIEYRKKYSGFEQRTIGDAEIRTLALEEFVVEKTISFFTREEFSGMVRDAYDLFMLEKKYGVVQSLSKKEKHLIRKNIISLDFNIGLFEKDGIRCESAVSAFLKKPIQYADVLGFLKSLKGALK